MIDHPTPMTIEEALAIVHDSFDEYCTKDGDAALAVIRDMLTAQADVIAQQQAWIDMANGVLDNVQRVMGEQAGEA